MRKFSFELAENGTVISAKWDESEKGYYCTNKNGEGVFHVISAENSRKQITGTWDFSVCGLKPASARAKINKKFSQD